MSRAASNLWTPLTPALPDGVVTYPFESGSALPHYMELIGSRFGHIRIVDILGQGGMGDVYAGYDETLQRRVALKAIRPEQRLDAEARSRLIREARTLSQLEHPNICRIYDYIEGEEVDLLVLELIEGKTLEEALRDGLSPTEKLRIADAIARVLVAAHRAGIIHRDLKPENVMLTPAGEVKVLDFGLARWAEKTHMSSGSEPSVKATESIRSQLLHVSEKVQNEWFPVDDTNSTLVVPTVMVLPTPEKKRDRGLLTAAGVTMGTPLYMSPEQARGETLTPASDMYSFGLVMQTLCTGREPYEATMGGREVMMAASRGESLPVVGTTRDITALIERLKQLAPTDRPTAVEALDRLRWIAERPKRLVRELTAAIVLIIVVLSAWKYVTDLRRERAAAVAAETEARARRAQAEDLMSFMLGDLRKKLEPVGKLDVLDDVAGKALQYVGSLREEELTPAELVRNARALNQLGEVRMGQGNLSAALPVFKRALRFATAAQQRDPKNEDARLVFGTTHFWLGNHALQDGDVPTALQHMKAYLVIAEQLSSQHPTNAKYAMERADGETVVGVALERQGNIDEALAHYHLALSIQSAEAARQPGDTELQGEIARTTNKIALAQQKSGDLVDARQKFESEIAIYEKLLAKDPSQMLWRNRLANAHGFAGLLLEDLGDPASLPHLRTEIAINDQLCAFDKTNADWERNRAISFSHVATAYASRGDHAASLAASKRAEEMLLSLILRDPKRTGWRRDLAAVQLGHARESLTVGDVAGARLLMAQAAGVPVAILDNNTRIQLLTIRGELAEIGGDRDSARRLWEEALVIAKPLAMKAADGRALGRCARLLLLLHRDGEAESLLRRLDAMHYRNSSLDLLRRERASARTTGTA
jgi:serine/threonine protein kinase